MGGVVGAVVYDVFIHHTLRIRGVPAAAEVEAEGRTVKEEAGTTAG